MNNSQLQKIIKEEIDKVLNNHILSEKQKWTVSNAILMAELLDPNGDAFEYTVSNGIYTYMDSKDNLFFVRLSYEATEDPFFVLKTGWFKNNDILKPMYEPSLPDDVSIYDGNIRTNTIAKIYQDEVLPLFDKQSLSDKMVIEPLSISRYQFAIRMVKKLTPSIYDIIEQPFDKILIIKNTHS